MGIAFESNPNHATWRRGRNNRIGAGVVDDMSCLGCPAQIEPEWDVENQESAPNLNLVLGRETSDHPERLLGILFWRRDPQFLW